jgi:hypothetical protein
MTSDTFSCVRVEGSILPTDLLQRVSAGDARLEGLRVEDYGLVGEKINEATNNAWARLSAAWESFKTVKDALPPLDSGHKLTVERWLLPFWKVLGYSTLDKRLPFIIDDKVYPISHVRHHSPFHLVGFRQDLDKRTEVEGKQFSPHGLVQEFLNRSKDHLWGFVSNGLKLRILRDNIRLSRQAYVEFDLQAMFEGKQYSDFALLWRLCHESRVTGEKPEECWLERWSKVAAEHGLRALDQLRTGVENAVNRIREKERQYIELKSDARYRTSGRFLADAWCAAFVWKKTKDADLLPMTHARFRRIEKHPHDIGTQEFDEVQRLAEEYQFFHWHLAFPGVFSYPAKNESPDNELTGWCGGFDVVLGNPPWDQIQLDPQEYFASRDEGIANAQHMAARERMIAQLHTTRPALFAEYQAAKRHNEGAQHFIHQSGRFPKTSFGRLNTAPLFCELSRHLIAPTGRIGVVVPSGIATDSFNQYFFQDVAESGALVNLFSFFEIRLVFTATDSRNSFCLLTLTGRERPATAAEFIFDARSVEDLSDCQKRFTLSPAEFALLNPNTRTCPVFRTARDADLTKAIYRRVPVLGKDGPPPVNPWGIEFQLMFMMNTGSRVFRTAEELQAEEWQLNGNVFHKGNTQYLPLYEAKLLHQFDHRWATYTGTESSDVNAEAKADPNYVIQPRYWVPASSVDERLDGRWNRNWLIGWRDITRNTDTRTNIASILPRTGIGGTIFLMFPSAAESAELTGLFATLCSFVFDYVARQKVGGTHFNVGPMKQLPVLPPDEYAKLCLWDRSQTLTEWMKPRVLELVYTACDLKPFAEDLSYTGDPFVWDETRRAVIRAELDAAFFHLYGISEADADYVLETFPIVKERDEERFGTYRTKEMILRCYQEMQEAAADQTGRTVFASQLDPPPGVPVQKDLFGYPVISPRRDRVIQAFVETRAGWSSEYVVCSPDANARYIRQAQTLVPNITEEDANRELWNARRDGRLAHLPKSRTYSPDPKLKPYEFVIEWAYPLPTEPPDATFKWPAWMSPPE